MTSSVNLAHGRPRVIGPEARQQLVAAAEARPLRGLSAGQPSRTTRRPTAARMLEAFGNLTPDRTTLSTRVVRHPTPRSELQQRLLALASLGSTCHGCLVGHASAPPIHA
jgi:hypothetical protein